jgi:hypothetical protein
MLRQSSASAAELAPSHALISELCDLFESLGATLQYAAAVLLEQPLVRPTHNQLVEAFARHRGPLRKLPPRQAFTDLDAARYLATVVAGEMSEHGSEALRGAAQCRILHPRANLVQPLVQKRHCNARKLRIAVVRLEKVPTRDGSEFQSFMAEAPAVCASPPNIPISPNSVPADRTLSVTSAAADSVRFSSGACLSGAYKVPFRICIDSNSAQGERL